MLTQNSRRVLIDKWIYSFPRSEREIVWSKEEQACMHDVYLIVIHVKVHKGIAKMSI